MKILLRRAGSHLLADASRSASLMHSSSSSRAGSSINNRNRVQKLCRKVPRWSLHQQPPSLSSLHSQLSTSRAYSELLQRLQSTKHTSDIGDKVAIVDTHPSDLTVQRILTYKQLYAAARLVAFNITKTMSLGEMKTIALYCKPGAAYVVSMLAAWMLGKKVTPLSPSHPLHEITYFLEDSSTTLVLYSSEDASKDALMASVLSSNELKKLVSFNVANSLMSSDSTLVDADFDNIISATNKDANNKDCLVVYTSGTTGKPKGALHTHVAVEHMMKSITSSWEYSEKDYVLHFLPLHHIHGILNKLLCTLWSYGTIEFLPSAHQDTLWRRLSETNTNSKSNVISLADLKIGEISRAQPTMFHAVPTIYSRLLESYKNCLSSGASVKVGGVEGGRGGASLEQIKSSIEALKKMRMHVCGSAALPDVTMESWFQMTGKVLLERYGMTELGMVLSNIYSADRAAHSMAHMKVVKGRVGLPLPYMKCRIVDDNENVIEQLDTPGSLRVKGECVFKEYLNKEKATTETFDKDGWFITGDVAQICSDHGTFKLLGRASADVIKSSGYKLSALEIEREILSHPNVLETAVLGSPDEILGEKVVSVIVLRDKSKWQDPSASLREFLHDRLAKYKQPKEVLIADSIPRNHMGKVNKKTLLKDLGFK